MIIMQALSLPTLRPSTVCSIQLAIDNSMVDDSDTSHHHDSHWLVDLAALCNEIAQTGASFHALLDTIIPLPVPPTIMTMAPDSTYNDNVPCCFDSWQPRMTDNNNDFTKNTISCQPMDLLDQQHEIQQFRNSMQIFFNSLLASTSATLCSNNPKEFNGQQNLLPPPDDLMTAAWLTHHTAPSTLSAYLSYMTTKACYIPTCLLQCYWLTDIPHLPAPTWQHTMMMTNQFQHHSACQATRICQHMSYQAFLVCYITAFWVPVNHVLPTQLDCLLDQPQSIYTPPKPLPNLTHLSCHPCSNIQLWYTRHNSQITSKPVIIQAIPPPVASIIGMHDLKPPLTCISSINMTQLSPKPKHTHSFNLCLFFKVCVFTLPLHGWLPPLAAG